MLVVEGLVSFCITTPRRHASTYRRATCVSSCFSSAEKDTNNVCNPSRVSICALGDRWQCQLRQAAALHCIRCMRCICCIRSSPFRGPQLRACCFLPSVRQSFTDQTCISLDEVLRWIQSHLVFRLFGQCSFVSQRRSLHHRMKHSNQKHSILKSSAGPSF